MNLALVLQPSCLCGRHLWRSKDLSTNGPRSVAAFLRNRRIHGIRSVRVDFEHFSRKK
jgi:hypothetical protein